MNVESSGMSCSTNAWAPILHYSYMHFATKDGGVTANGYIISYDNIHIIKFTAKSNSYPWLNWTIFTYCNFVTDNNAIEIRYVEPFTNIYS